MRESDLLDLAVDAARCAGRLIAATLAGGGSPVLQSSARDLKLAVDLQAEAIIRERLRRSGIAVLGEENGWAGEGESPELCWIVDGLDGTVNVHYGIPFAAVSIALSRLGQPELGVVYDFHRDEMFSGRVGLGAFCNGVPVSVSNVASRRCGLLLSAIATKMDASPDRLATFAAGLGQWKKIRMLGSAALSLAYVAAGRADACELASIMLWDVAAGVALVRAAGGSAGIAAGGEEHVVDVFAHNGQPGLAAVPQQNVGGFPDEIL
nr:inositol monophosphatase family protein [uncultured Rhodopila sp.]